MSDQNAFIIDFGVDAGPLNTVDVFVGEDLNADFVYEACSLLRFDSVQVLNPRLIRARFTRAISADSASVSNFTLIATTADSVPAITMVTKASDDAEVLDVYLNEDLKTGGYRMTVNDIISIEGYKLI